MHFELSAAHTRRGHNSRSLHLLRGKAAPLGAFPPSAIWGNGRRGKHREGIIGRPLAIYNTSPHSFSSSQSRGTIAAPTGIVQMAKAHLQPILLPLLFLAFLLWSSASVEARAFHPPAGLTYIPSNGRMMPLLFFTASSPMMEADSLDQPAFQGQSSSELVAAAAVQKRALMRLGKRAMMRLGKRRK